MPARAADAPAQPQTFYRQRQQFRIGFTTNTRGGWNEVSPFVGFREARDIGFRYVEVFGHVFCKGGAYGAPGAGGGNRPAPPPNKAWPDGYVFVPPTAPPLVLTYTSFNVSGVCQNRGATSMTT